MRIIGNIDHPILKITVLMMDMKYAVKMEAGLFEQTYKIRESDNVRCMEDISRLVDEQFINDCLNRFQQMQADLFAAFDRDMGRANIT